MSALIVGAGVIAVQLLMSAGGGDADGDLHSDLDASGDLDAAGAQGDLGSGAVAQHGEVGSAAVQLATGQSAPEAGLDASGAPGHPDLVGIWLFLSLRFWTFALLAFGLLGCFLHYLNLASVPATAVSSTLLGLFCGWLAAKTFRALAASNPNSGAGSAELVGQVGKVLLAQNASGRTKVRLRVKGQTIDFVATSDEPLAVGASILVEEVRGQDVHVSPAPAGLAYSDEPN